MAKQAYTTTARGTTRDLRNLIVRFSDSTVIEATDLDEFEDKWKEAGCPPAIKHATSNGYDCALYPCVLALGPIAAVALTNKTGSPVFQNEGMTCRDAKQARELLMELTKIHASRGSDAYAPKKRMRAFQWQGRIYEGERIQRRS